MQASRKAARLALGKRAEVQARRRQVRGLLLLALAALVFSILRTGLARSFTVGWWRLW